MTAHAQPQPNPNVVWFDIPALDLARAVRFYRAVLAVEMETQEFPGGAIAILPHSDQVIGGCIFVSKDAKPGTNGPLLYLNAAGRLDAAIAAATANGGTVLEAKQSIAPHGWRAVLRDSEGNRIALHSMTE